jgi:NAD(P)H dehydrogenase (quinone)
MGQLFTAIAAGELAAVSDVVQRLAGHPPVTLAAYVTANPESLAHVRGNGQQSVSQA